MRKIFLVKENYIFMNCDKCLYAGLCKYEDSARKFENVVKKFAKENVEVEQPICVEVLIKCNRFKMKYGQKEDGNNLR